MSQTEDMQQMMSERSHQCAVALPQHATFDDCHSLLRLAASRTNCLHLCHYIHTIHDLSEDDVLAVEPLGLDRSEEKLGSIGVWSCIGHAQNTWAGVLEIEVLIRKLLPIDALATSAITTGEVTTLNHEVGDDAVERAALVVKRLARLASALVAGAERPH